MAAYEAAIRKPIEDKGWESPSFDDSSWKEMPVPKKWAENGLNIDGVVWFRRTVTVPKSWEVKTLTISLGPVDDEDVTYWNGVKLGAKKAWNKPRIYTIAADLVKAGTAVVAVRVNDTGYGGGMYGAPEEMYLSPSAETAGSWLERKRDWLRRSR